MRVRYHREAREELDEATERYEAGRPGLGLEFIDEVEGAVASIRERPERWPLWPGITSRLPVRRFVLQRFPFAIPYLVHGGMIVVLAVAHGRRRPGYWRGRLRAVDPR